jgi:hypothetical protein
MTMTISADHATKYATTLISQKTSEALGKFQDAYIAYLASVIFLCGLEKSKDSDSDSALHSLFEKYESNLGTAIRSTPRFYFHAQLFISMISSLELFFQEAISGVLQAYPKKVGSVQFKLSEILDAGTTDELILRAAEEYIMKLMYKKPLEYLEEITRTLSIDSASIRPFWPTFIEAKARRDLGMHNGWKCNSTYIRKLEETGITSSFQVGDDTFPYDDTYMNGVGHALSEISKAIYVELGRVYKFESM